MFFEILVLLFIGALFGIVFGLLPGIHPNMLVLLIPFFISLNLEPFLFLSFVVALAVTNNIVNFIPSSLLGAPDSGNELSVMPGHRMLLEGDGYNVIRLTVLGSLGGMVFCAIIFPLVIFIVPFLFLAFTPFIYAILLSIVGFMVLTEEGNKKAVSLFVFLLSGIVGLAIGSIPVDNTLVLFPVISGLFGMPTLVLQIRQKTRIPEQTGKELFLSKKLVNSSIVSGSVSGIFSGLLPGVGSSEIASLVSADKNSHSFLIKLSALTTANIVLSVMALWLIGKSRSGISILIEQVTPVGFSEIIFVLIVALVATGIASAATLFLARIFINTINKVNYTLLSLFVIAFIVALVVIFTGFYGAFLLFVSACLGIFANLAGIKRGIMMGVLILPTILFYLS
ncbi:MAG: tripartite tricarboxylate transporter permease [Candidatus Aenigmarchaeota archaeon]|nr:tripartite tricarboxylate transporter permease [Candidatus Aenigmarchaeota archaeon]